MTLTCVAYFKNGTSLSKEYLKRLNFSEEIILVGNNIDNKLIDKSKFSNVIIFPLNGREYDVNTKNLLISKAKGKWILFTNSDESLSINLAREIEVGIKSNKFDGYFIKIVDDLQNKLIHSPEHINNYQIRLGKKNKGEWESEGKGVETWELRNNIGVLSKSISRIVNPTLEELITEINDYTTFHARELFMEQRKENLFSIIFFPVGKFVIDYFLKKGLLYGTNGFVYNALMSFRTLLTRAKLWMLWKEGGR